ncbi:MAG TPA: nuclear transport factor 2 family protein [Sphingomicrobium sp.]
MGIAAAAPVTVPPQPALTEQVERADAELFDLFFVARCDERRFRALLADDVEFYHDKDGFGIRSAADFMAAYRQNCAARADAGAWRSRRVLVAGSLHVDPVPGWGAIETGDHLFFERHGVDGAERLAGKARFAMVWVLGSDGKWRVSRVLSFAHQAAP